MFHGVSCRVMLCSIGHVCHRHVHVDVYILMIGVEWSGVVR